MRFWLAFAIEERFATGGGRSLDFRDPSFPSFDDAIQALVDTEPPAVAGQVIEANAYVVRAETTKEAADLLWPVFERHETSPHVKLVERGIRTRRVPQDPPEIQALTHVHGELCITHQITEFALGYAEDGEYRDRLVRHKEAIEDLAYALRVKQAEMAGQAPPEMPPRGSERVGYGFHQLEGSESASLAGALSSLAAELSIAERQTRIAQKVFPDGEPRLDELVAELSMFAATVSEYAQF